MYHIEWHCRDDVKHAAKEENLTGEAFDTYVEATMNAATVKLRTEINEVCKGKENQPLFRLSAPIDPIRLGTMYLYRLSV